MFLEFIDAIKKDNLLYFFGWNVCGLFTYDLINGELELLLEPTEYEELESRVYGAIEKSGEDIFLAPCFGRTLKKISKNELKLYDLSKVLIGEKVPFFIRAEIVGDGLWMIPYHASKIIEFDLGTEKVINSICLYSKDAEDNKDIYLDYMGRVGRCFFLFSFEWQMIIEVDFEKKEIIRHKLKNVEKIFYAICEEEKIWLWAELGQIYESRIDNYDFREICCLPMLKNEKGVMLFLEKKLWFFLDKKNVYFTYDIKSKVCEEHNILNGNEVIKLGNAFVKVLDSKIYCFPYEGEWFVEINPKNFRYRISKILLNEEQQQYLARNYIKKANLYRSVIKENECVILDYFLNQL